jgi:hypothetical protein
VAGHNKKLSYLEYEFDAKKVNHVSPMPKMSKGLLEPREGAIE